ncbi:MAG: protein kinase [Deltaproteobacteria bacterium]|nr:protein kinase [Deltaproteobacteria bacterium]
MSTPPDPHTPQKLGRYQLLERIAVGGMAEVYKAVALGLSGFEKTVVVKRLLPQHQRDQELLTMFVDEARLLGRLRHPNIAEVYDIDHEGNEYFFALEYVDGVELRDLLNDTPGIPLSDEEAVWITCELAKALAYAHGLLDDEGQPLGIVHRDISPSNVLIGQTGAVKLVDFGVAKWRSQRSETRHGVLKGKVSYMSPEQCRGEPLDSRSDVFALGVLLYEMTVGSRPFARTSDFETLKAIAEGHFIKPSVKRPGYPAPLERLCVAMMELDRSQRPTDMREVVAALQDYAASAGIALGPQTLAARAAKAVTLREPRTPTGESHEEPHFAQAIRFPVDRTATAVATVESLVTAVTPMPESTSAVAPHSRRRLKLSVGVGAVAAGAALILFWLRPVTPMQTETATATRSAPVEVPQPAPVVKAAEPVAMDPPAAVIQRKRSTVIKDVNTRPRQNQPSQESSPRAASSGLTGSAAVWDPDSPVPP